MKETNKVETIAGEDNAPGKQLEFGKQSYEIKYRCGCVEEVRRDTTPQPRERLSYVDYDCSNCWY